MVSYKVITTPKALSQLNDYIDYIQHTLLNNQAANAVWEDTLETVERLESVAGCHEPCNHPKLKAYGYYQCINHDTRLPSFCDKYTSVAALRPL